MRLVKRDFSRSMVLPDLLVDAGCFHFLSTKIDKASAKDSEIFGK